ncbi:MAG TPA: Chromate resistance protein ChrB [Candidatus Dormibacteraeota bacterium]
MAKTQRPTRFVVLVYRMPQKPTAGRIAVWRLLKKVGAIYLQQSVCIFPDTAGIRREIRPILGKINEAGGEYHLMALRQPPADEEQKLVQQFLDQTSKHYQEIIENCEVNFQKEIEFETFRKNFTYEEAEEIRNEFEKIVSWFERVQQRDWFGAPNRAEAKAWLDRCQGLLEGFEAKVYEAQEQAGTDGHEAPRVNGQRRRVRVVPSLPSTVLRG